MGIGARTNTSARTHLFGNSTQYRSKSLSRQPEKPSSLPTCAWNRRPCSVSTPDRGAHLDFGYALRPCHPSSAVEQRFRKAQVVGSNPMGGFAGGFSGGFAGGFAGGLCGWLFGWLCGWPLRRHACIARESRPQSSAVLHRRFEHCGNASTQANDTRTTHEPHKRTPQTNPTSQQERPRIAAGPSFYRQSCAFRGTSTSTRFGCDPIGARPSHSPMMSFTASALPASSEP